MTEAKGGIKLILKINFKHVFPEYLTKKCINSYLKLFNWPIRHLSMVVSSQVNLSYIYHGVSQSVHPLSVRPCWMLVCVCAVISSLFCLLMCQEQTPQCSALFWQWACVCGWLAFNRLPCWLCCRHNKGTIKCSRGGSDFFSTHTQCISSLQSVLWSQKFHKSC